MRNIDIDCIKQQNAVDIVAVVVVLSVASVAVVGIVVVIVIVAVVSSSYLWLVSPCARCYIYLPSPASHPHPSNAA